MKWLEFECSTNGLQIRTTSNGFELSLLSDGFNLGWRLFWFGWTIWLPGLMIELSYINRRECDRLKDFFKPLDKPE